EWFKGEIIEAVLEIISSTRETVALKRKKKERPEPMTSENTERPVMPDGGGQADGAAQEMCMVSQIPNLRVKSLFLKLTEAVQGGYNSWGHQVIDPSKITVANWLDMMKNLDGEDCSEKAMATRNLTVSCSYELKCLMEFERDLDRDELRELREILLNRASLKPRYLFFDEDKCVIPFSASSGSDTYVHGTEEVITGVAGERFRLIVMNSGTYRYYPEGSHHSTYPYNTATALQSSHNINL